MSERFYSDIVSDKITNEDEYVAGVDVKERAAYVPPKIYCSRCQKGIHNISENDQRCLGSRKKSRSDCQCSCQTHYVGRDGRLRKYGAPDDSRALEDIPVPAPDPFIERMNAEWHESHGTVPRGEPEKEVVL